MRVFLALPISENLQAEILEWEDNFLKRYGFDNDRLIRWLAGKNLHITLIPPWYENDVEGLKKELASLEGKFKPVEAEFKNVGYGPDSKNPRLIWAGGETPPPPGRGKPEILELKRGLENFLGMKPEKRPFRLHLTLARFRPEIFSSFKIKNLNEKIFWREKFDSFVLMESRLLPAGADYKILKSVRLKS